MYQRPLSTSSFLLHLPTPITQHIPLPEIPHPLLRDTAMLTIQTNNMDSAPPPSSAAEPSAPNPGNPSSSSSSSPPSSSLTPSPSTSTPATPATPATTEQPRRPLRDRIAQHITRRKNINKPQPEQPKDIETTKNEPSSSTATPSETTFECNVCFDVPRDPVVTPCGHLYCWSCLYKWMKVDLESPQCPVCKACIAKSTVIPIYGRGRTQADDPRHRPLLNDDYVPPRPTGHRPNNMEREQERIRSNVGASRYVPFGYHRFGFGGGTPAQNTQTTGGQQPQPGQGQAGYPDNYEFSFGNYSIFPNFFGLQMAYPNIDEPPRDDIRDNQEEAVPELVAKLFVLLAFMIAAIIITF